MIQLTATSVIELGVSVVLFVVCLVGFIHTKGIIKNIDVTGDEGENSFSVLKKKKKIKKLFFVGIVFSVWFFIGVLITAFSGKHGGMHLEFSMFSERVNVFGFSLAQTTVISLAVCLTVTLFCVIFRLFLFPKFKEEPKGLQNVIEICVESMDNFTKKAVGDRASNFLSPYMFTIALYLIGNASVELFGLRAPTSDLTCTLAIGLLTFILLNVFGLKRLGLGGRLKSMGGPVVPMRVIMIPLKMVSDIAVPVSLACRLFGNMLGGMIVMELLKGALGGFASGITGIAGLYFNLFHPLIQAYIFITLSLTFIDEAMQPVAEN
ncbi:MAG: F0F1 ATP synthase subunit A [Acutalibacteraceae bacterium]